MVSTMIERIFSQFRKVSIIAVFACSLGSLLMFFIGAVKVGRAFDSYLFSLADAETTLASKAGLSIAYLVQAIDAFLIALVLLIFGHGIFQLFVSNVPTEEQGLLGPFRVKNIAELKRILADMIVIILMVKFLESALINTQGFQWEALVLPGAIFLLAGAVRVLNLER